MEFVAKIFEAIANGFKFFTGWFDPKARASRIGEEIDAGIIKLQEERDRLLAEECKTNEAKEKNAIALGNVTIALNKLRKKREANNKG